MVEQIHSHLVFKQLQNLTVPFFKSTNNEEKHKYLSEIIDLLPKIDNESMQKSFDYIWFPLAQSLRFQNQLPLNETVIIDIFNIMKILLTRCPLFDFSKFIDCFRLFIDYIGPIKTGIKKLISEDIILQVILALKALLTFSLHNHSILPIFISEKFRVIIGFSISVLLDLVKNQKLRQIRVNTLSVIETFCVDDCLMTPFFPGIISAVWKIISGDFKQGHSVIIASLRLWTALIKCVLSDRNNTSIISSSSFHDWASFRQKLKFSFNQLIPEKSHISTQSSLLSSSSSNTSSNTKNINILRDKTWLRDTGHHLLPLLSLFTNITKNSLSQSSHFKIRQEMVCCCYDLFHHCFHIFQTMTGNSNLLLSLIETLMFLAEDEYPQVHEKAREKISLIFSFSSSSFFFSPDLVDIIEMGIMSHLTSLPRLLVRLSSSSILQKFRILSTYQRLLGLFSISHLTQFWQINFSLFSFSLLKSLSIDTKNIYILEKNFEEEKSYYSIKFLYYDSDITENTIFNFIKILGQYSHVHILVDLFLDIIQKNQIFIKEIILCINYLIVGSGSSLQNNWISDNFPKPNHNSLSLSQSINLLLEVYLSDGLWKKITDISSNDNDDIILQSLLLRGIGDFSFILQQDISFYLPNIFYPILEQLASPHHIINQSALATLSCISESCGYSSLEDLVQNNTDYLIDCLATRLRFHSEDSSTLHVLQALLSRDMFSTIIVPLLDDSILYMFRALEVQRFFSSTFDFHDNIYILLSIFLYIVKAIHSIRLKESLEYQKNRPEYTPHLNQNSDISSYDFLNWLSPHNPFYKINKVSSMFKQFVEIREKENEPIPPFDIDLMENQEIKKSKSVKVSGEIACPDEKQQSSNTKLRITLVNIIKNAQYFLSSVNLNRQSLVLNICIHGIHALACCPLPPSDSEKENMCSTCKSDLLPLVATIWKTFRLRLHETYLRKKLEIGINQNEEIEERIIKRSQIKLFLELVEIMVKYCRNFLSQRFQKDVWPSIKQMLAEEQHNNVSFSLHQYHLEPSFIIQLQGLTTLTNLALYPEIIRNFVYTIAWNCHIYLNQTQPKELQEQTILLFKNLSKVDSNIIWFVLMKISEGANVQFSFPNKEIFSNLAKWELSFPAKKKVTAPKNNPFLLNCQNLFSFLEKSPSTKIFKF